MINELTVLKVVTNLIYYIAYMLLYPKLTVCVCAQPVKPVTNTHREGYCYIKLDHVLFIRI